MRARSVVLLGPMGSGKSTVGPLVARSLGLPFHDLDDLVAAAAGMTVADIFRQEGEARFRERETAALERILTGPPCLLAAGGGAVLSAANRILLARRADPVVLWAAPEELARRVAGSDRPLLAGAQDPAARLAEVMAARADAYAAFGPPVESAGYTVEEVARAVAARLARGTTVAVSLGERSYPVHICRGGPVEALAAWPQRLAGRPLILVTDRHVDDLYGDGVAAALAARGPVTARLAVAPGEPSKAPEPFLDLLDRALAAGPTRDTVVVALGGGVAGDLAGFLAAILLRGLTWVQLPTTLLALVDSSVGGKTGIDHRLGKNLIGAFHQPAAVLAGVEALASLPPRELRAGLAEVAKTALLADPGLWRLLAERPRELLAGEPGLMVEVVRRCVAVKAEVVARDEREGGLRRLLNLGHTVGHALEVHGAYQTHLHGEAVALGLLAAARLSELRGWAAAGLEEEVRRVLSGLQLPVELDPWLEPEILAPVRLDKKVVRGDVNFVALGGVGRPMIRPMAPEALIEALAGSRRKS